MHPVGVQYGIFVPNLGPFGDCEALIGLARAAESAGWDGFFIWDTVLLDLADALDAVDPWIALAAIAIHTDLLRFGALVTPLARRRPWKVARETTTLDRLSSGRLVFGAGLGGPVDAEFEAFGEVADARERATLLDRGLETLAALWSGEPTRLVEEPLGPEIPGFRPVPVQRPRPPVWIAGWWPNKAPLRRAARWDGVFPQLHDGALPSVEDLCAIKAYVDAHRESSAPFDVVLAGITPNEPEQAGRQVAPYVDAGLTWWLEEANPDVRFSVDEMRDRILAGPPRIPDRS